MNKIIELLESTNSRLEKEAIVKQAAIDGNEEFFEGARLALSKFVTFGVKKVPTFAVYRDWETDRKSTRLNSSHSAKSRMPSSA